MSLTKQAPWLLFIVFVITAIYFSQGESLFLSQSPYPQGKLISWILFAGFLAYTYYCSLKENLFTTIKRTWPFYWSRQIGLDLYIGLSIFMFIVYLNEGAWLVVALWVVPVILFANLATLLYLAINYDSIVAHFLS